MAIKWNITNKAMEARGNMDAISRAYDRLNNNARGHRADIEGLADQVDEMQSDLEHAANIMGNGGGAGEAQEPSKPPAAVQQPEPQTSAQATAPDSPGGTAANAVGTFHG